MVKKVKKELDVVLEELNLAPEEVQKDRTISPLTADFGRADLNLLRDKLNELIARA